MVTMRKRSMAGNCGIIVFMIALVTVALAFGTPSWLVSDYRIRGAKLDRLGLWSHCFRSLPDPLDQYQRRFFVGCRWVYDPFTTGYDKIRGYLLPGFMIATQLFFTLCLIGVLISTVLVIVFFLCCGPDQNRYVMIIRAIGFLMLAAGISGGIAVIVFASLGNTDGWMPDHSNNYLGWSFGLGVVGAVACLVTAALFLTEANIQLKKRKRLKESQARFEMEHESKA
ncbi:voltage-dependent calcium channel gamma-4 subunit isoform X1 [Maniola hyperantus]|uniref:voltage-dependent calcium channel gamma-4 subunit isoform X1 n=2 Tax=Aphantopus hyperantus TaxID=2795564 RepID=UPI002137C9F1